MNPKPFIMDWTLSLAHCLQVFSSAESVHTSADSRITRAECVWRFMFLQVFWTLWMLVCNLEMVLLGLSGRTLKRGIITGCIATDEWIVAVSHTPDCKAWWVENNGRFCFIQLKEPQLSSHCTFYIWLRNNG